MMHHITLPGTTFQAWIDVGDNGDFKRPDFHKLILRLYRSNGGTISKGKPARPDLYPVVHPVDQCETHCPTQPERVKP